MVLRFLKEILLNPSATNYIAALQAPTVLCLAFTCYQAYKLGFKEFKLISVAWLVNLGYLGVNIFLGRDPLPRTTFIIITAVDILYIYTFVLATEEFIAHRLPPKWRPFTQKKWTMPVFILFGIFKCIPGSLHIIPYIHLRYLPSAVLDGLALVFLALYFKSLSPKLRRGKILFGSTLVYAIDQLLAIAQRDTLDHDALLYLNNIAFSIGLIAKIGVLVSLSLSIAGSIQITAQEEKEKLLRKIKFAASKLKLTKDPLTVKEVANEENNILESVLSECLSMLDQPLGYYAAYNAGENEIKMIFTSEKYRGQTGTSWSADIGMTGKAAKLQALQVVNSRLDESPYFRSVEIKDMPNSDIDKNVKSVVVIPIVVDDNTLGVYVFENEDENHFTDIDVQILQATISQAQTAIANIRLVKENEFGKTVLESLKKIDKGVMELRQAQDLPRVLDFILHEALKTANEEIGNIALLNPHGKLVLVASTNQDNIGKPIDIHDSISGRAVLQKETQYIPDMRVAAAEIKKLYKNFLSDNDNLICSLVVPLKVRGKVIGIFNAESPTADKFRNEQGNVEGYAGQAAIAIQIFKLIEDVEATREHLKALAEVELQMLSENKGLSETLEMILDTSKKLIKKDKVELLLLNADNDLVIKKTTFPGDVVGRKISLNSICGLSIERRKAIYVPFVDKDEYPDEMIEESFYLPTKMERERYKRSRWGQARSELCLPLIIKDKVIGVFNLESEKYEDFHSDERMVLYNLALAAAIAIHNAQLFEEISLQKKELENSIKIDRIILAQKLSTMVNHGIGNTVGIIRALAIDLVDGEFGPISPEATTEIIKIKESAQITLDARDKMDIRVRRLIGTVPTPIHFAEVQQKIISLGILSLYPDITISVEGVENLPPVLADPDLFDEVISELITNAIKAMDEAGPVTIWGSHDDSFVSLSFADKGCGMDEEKMGKIFDRNYSSWPNVAQGGGVGLFLVKSTLDFYYGSIDVYSRPGAGSTFVIKLPILRNPTNHSKFEI